MSRNLWRGLLWGGLAAAVFGLAILTPGPGAAAQETKVRLGAPSGGVTLGGAAFAVDVLVDDAANLGAFELTLVYDSSVLGFVSYQQGSFLASSGREVHCMDPTIAPGSIHLTCVTLGATPPGADGSGVLATVTLAPAALGTSPLHLEGAILARPDGQQISATAEDASITVISPGAPQTPSPTGPAPVATVAQTTLATATSAAATPTAATPVGPSPTPIRTPATTASSDNGGTNWPLWGSVIGVAAVLVAGGAGVFWWSRARRPS